MYASVLGNGLKTFTSDCFNISELQKRKQIVKIYYTDSCSKTFFVWSFNLLLLLVYEQFLYYIRHRTVPLTSFMPQSPKVYD
jgi:hypothetical protein